jgi:hypothetical protein
MPQGQAIGAWRGVFKRVEDGRRQPTLLVDYPWNGHKAASGVAYSQGVEGNSIAGPDEALGILWPSLAIRPCCQLEVDNRFLSRLIYAFLCLPLVSNPIGPLRLQVNGDISSGLTCHLNGFPTSMATQLETGRHRPIKMQRTTICRGS